MRHMHFLSADTLAAKTAFFLWAKSQIHDTFTCSELSIECPVDHCKMNICYEELKATMIKSNFELIDDIYLHHYLKNASDVRYCPAPNCNNAGVFVPSLCKDSLECKKCSKKWTDSSQLSTQGQAYSLLSIQIAYSEYLSEMRKFFLGKQCPQCGITIFKDGGCPHIVCKKCNYEFCWQCMESYKSYAHNSGSTCKQKGIILKAIFYISLLLINFKLCNASDDFLYAEIYLLQGGALLSIFAGYIGHFFAILYIYMAQGKDLIHWHSAVICVLECIVIYLGRQCSVFGVFGPLVTYLVSLIGLIAFLYMMLSALRKPLVCLLYIIENKKLPEDMFLHILE